MYYKDQEQNTVREAISEASQEVFFIAEICVPELRDGRIKHQIVAIAYSQEHLERLLKGFPREQIEVHIRFDGEVTELQDVDIGAVEGATPIGYP